MNKLERLLNLTAALLETRRPMTAEEIHRRIPGYPDRDESFRRAFERDKDDLREMGVPLELVDIGESDPPTVGYLIRPDQYYLPDPGLTPDEVAALQIAALSIRLGESDGDLDLDAVRKLGGRETSAPGDVDELAAIPRPRHLDALFDAVAARRPVRFGYGGRDREVHPHRLEFHKGRWYLSGHDVDREAERHFRLDRFESDVTLGEPGGFERPDRPPGIMAEPWELGEGDPMVARLLIDAAQVAQARNQLPDHTPWEPRPDGSAVATIRVVNPGGFRSFVLTFLDHAEVLDPPELRDDIVSWLRQLAATQDTTT